MISCILLLSVVLNAAGAVDAARASFDAGNYSAAVQTLNSALNESPKDPTLHFWALRSFYELRDFENAVAHGETAVKLDPQNAEYTRWLGRAYGAKAEQSRSFFLARKVKQAFEAAVRLAPNSIPARRDLMQFLAEAPWIVGGDKGKAREQIDVISKMDPIQGHMARGAYFAADKQWIQAGTEYAAALDQGSQTIDGYMEIADFFADRGNTQALGRAIEAGKRVSPKDPRLDYFTAVNFILRKEQLPAAEKLLRLYVANVPERSDYPSHKSAQEWLSRTNREAQAR
jgi:tetratricopeptide (TPR) repeat protein